MCLVATIDNNVTHANKLIASITAPKSVTIQDQRDDQCGLVSYLICKYMLIGASALTSSHRLEGNPQTG